MALRKIDLMHKLYGKHENAQCKECNHLNRNGYVKCEIYGNTRSEATDWKQKQPACGLFNKPYNTDIPVVRLVQGDRQETQIAGQLDLWGLGNGQ